MNKFFAFNYLLLIFNLFILLLGAVLFEFNNTFITKACYIFLSILFIFESVIFIFLLDKIKCQKCGGVFLYELFKNRKKFGDIRFEKQIIRILIGGNLVCNLCGQPIKNHHHH